MFAVWNSVFFSIPVSPHAVESCQEQRMLMDTWALFRLHVWQRAKPALCPTLAAPGNLLNQAWGSESLVGAQLSSWGWLQAGNNKMLLVSIAGSQLRLAESSSFAPLNHLWATSLGCFTGTELLTAMLISLGLKTAFLRVLVCYSQPGCLKSPVAWRGAPDSLLQPPRQRAGHLRWKKKASCTWLWGGGELTGWI